MEQLGECLVQETREAFPFFLFEARLEGGFHVFWEDAVLLRLYGLLWLWCSHSTMQVLDEYTQHTGCQYPQAPSEGSELHCT